MKNHRHTFRAMIVPVLVMTMFLAFACTAYGASVKTVKPSGKHDNTDIKRISNAVSKYKTVKLVKGKKYYLATPIHMKSNRTLIATGATITAKNDIIVTDLKKAGYSNVTNVTIKGGTWKSASKKGYKGTSIRFVHSSGIKLSGMKIRHANYSGHAVELIGCKDVVLDKLDIQATGTKNSSQESVVQIDIATDATYPRIKGTGLSNGAICSNVTVSNCKISGGRAIASGYDYKGQGYINNAHTGISILNNSLTSSNAEGVFLANVRDAVVSGNTIVSNFGTLSSDKAIGLHYLIVGQVHDTSLSCSSNTIKGGKYAIRAYSQVPDLKLTNVSITGNECYCRNGAGSAIQAADKGIENVDVSGNHTYKW